MQINWFCGIAHVSWKLKKATKVIVFTPCEKWKNMKKRSDVIVSTDTLSNEFKSNHTCYYISFSSSSNFALSNVMFFFSD